MENTDRRQIVRQSLDLRADFCIDGVHGQQNVGLRNISSGGLMADGAEHIRMGQQVRIYLPQLGWVDGAVAWVMGSRCGVAFRDELNIEQIDTLLACKQES